MKRTLLVTLAAGAALVLPATSAFAHATVNPREATQGDVDTARTFGILGMAFGLLGFVSAMAARKRRGPEASS